MDKLTVLILAGGQSTRMGQDKMWLVLAGEPLVERIARRMLPLAGEIVISTNQPEAFAGRLTGLPIAVRTVADRYPGAGPLAGLHAGLAVAHYELVLALATDMPFVDPALVAFLAGLAADHDAVMPLVPSPDASTPQPEPLHALYRRSCLPAIEAALAAGRRRAVSFLPQVRVRYVSPDEIRPYDPAFRSFANVNTPEEWAAVQAS
jgi:molybdenum cofactor guanylyltransferase